MATRLLDTLRVVHPLSHHGLLLVLGQVMMTPHHLRQTTPDFDDPPYVGYANAEAGPFTSDGRAQDAADRAAAALARWPGRSDPVTQRHRLGLP